MVILFNITRKKTNIYFIGKNYLSHVEKWSFLILRVSIYRPNLIHLSMWDRGFGTWNFFIFIGEMLSWSYGWHLAKSLFILNHNNMNIISFQNMYYLFSCLFNFI